MLIIISHSCVILKRIPTGFKFKLYLFYETARINIVFYSIVAFGTKRRIQWNLDIKNLYITKSFGITNDFLYPSNSKIYEKQPRYSEENLLVPWACFISRFTFHCIN